MEREEISHSYISEPVIGINNSLVLILRSHPSIAKYISAPLQVSQIWSSSLSKILNQAHEELHWVFFPESIACQ
jgi:hypothetical protein